MPLFTRIIRTMRMRSTCMAGLVCCLLSLHAGAQNKEVLKWWDAGSHKGNFIEGQAWPSETERLFDRLPARAKELVPPKLWVLSQHSAGQVIRFTTDARTIVVRYAVSGAISKFHMPATGVSGVDLYVMLADGSSQWIPGRHIFKDTIEYRFSNIAVHSARGAAPVFQLYLPLYNSVKWLHIGVPEKAAFNLAPVRSAKPIVVYGTSIVQGGCASRPGLAWTAILGRKLNLPVVNLGFSGNGKMEPPLTDLVNEIDGLLYILDCMPNLTRVYKISDAEIENRFSETIAKIQAKHPGTPILLAEHSVGHPELYRDTTRLAEYRQSSQLIRSIYEKLKKNGVRDLYLLTSEEIGFDIESTVDGLHPNDIGMMKYAEAFERAVRSIFPSFMAGSAGLDRRPGQNHFAPLPSSQSE